MKIIHGLCAVAITALPAGSILLPARASAADNLPAMKAPASTGGAVLNSDAPEGYLERAALMIADGNYRGAADQLGQAPRSETAEFLYAVACAHIPGEDATGLFSAFLEHYPASALRERALAGLAGTLYDRGDYAAALEIYRSVNADALNPSEAEEKMLNEAYCLLKFSRTDEARRIYDSLLSTPRANDARFYLAYIDYIGGDYRAALDGFLKVRQGDETPVSQTPYYLAQVYYRLGEYRKAADTARALLAGNCPEEYRPETQRVLGESLHELGDRAGAIPLLRQYVAAVETPRPSALYILGRDAYDRGEYAEAVELLTPVSRENNQMGQSAYLYIGQSYMQQGKYDPALLALDQAVKRDYDAKTTEIASYNYAVASARGGKVPFGSSVVLFEGFLRSYPDSELAPAVADYIISGYISDNNYGAALRAINGIKNPSDKIMAAKQQVLFLHGARQLQAGRTDDAVSCLTEARSLGRYSGEIASESTLWLGEAYYRKGDYAKAVENYNRFLKETPASNVNHPLALYDMAYARFARKEFSQAKDYFNKYLKSLGGSTPADIAGLEADAWNRLGDCNYYASDFATAAADYDRAIQASPSTADYPMFQTAVMKGLQRDHQGKIEGLAAMMSRFPASALIPSALLETGESYTELGNADKAIATYARLAERYPSTAQGRQGALLLAISRLNQGDTDQAIAAYKHVISSYPTSEEARAAAEDLKHIYADRGAIGQYTSFLASVPDAPKLEQGELAALQLEAVEKAYEGGRDNDAVRQAEELLTAFPDSPQAVGALAVLAEVKERQGRAAEALDAYRRLADKASNEIDINNARMGILRLSRDLGSDEAVLEMAEVLLKSSSLGKDDRNDVMLAQAMALRNTGAPASETDAILASLAATPSTQAGAKAAYYLAQGKFDRGDFDGALADVNSLIESNTPQEYWLARGFILLSDVYRRQGNTFEANEYLRSLKENYPGKEADIFEMIDSRLPAK